MMNKCLSCYQALVEGVVDYHPHCARAFFGVKGAPSLPYNLSDMERLAKEVAELSISVPGVQPKLSMGWIKTTLENGRQGRLTITDALGGNYILKPQNSEFPQMPENEHLSMMLAKLFEIEIVPANLIRLASGELCYITKRIDRNDDGSKNHMIDFLQILELADKYMGTMEMLGKKIGELSENTLLDKFRFLELTIFNYITGNNDMHLKNYSMYLFKNGWVLSPSYDLLNVKIILPKDKEDIALMLGGKKENFNKIYFDQLGQVLKLNSKQVSSIYLRLQKWIPEALQLIDNSFLDLKGKVEFKKIVESRVAKLIK